MADFHVKATSKEDDLCLEDFLEHGPHKPGCNWDRLYIIYPHYMDIARDLDICKGPHFLRGGSRTSLCGKVEYKPHHKKPEIVDLSASFWLIAEGDYCRECADILNQQPYGFSD